MHIVALYLNNLGYNCVLKLDFQNAFNSLHCDEMLEAVQIFVPFPLLFPFPFCSFCTFIAISAVLGEQDHSICGGCAAG